MGGTTWRASCSGAGRVQLTIQQRERLPTRLQPRLLRRVWLSAHGRVPPHVAAPVSGRSRFPAHAPSVAQGCRLERVGC